MLGYATAWAMRKPTPVPADLRQFHRREQMDRLRRLFRLRPSGASSSQRASIAAGARKLTS
jgi:hypothetical protein